MSAGGGMAMFGGLLGAGGAISEGEDKAAALEKEAEYADLNAAQSKKDAYYNAQRQQMSSVQKIGSIEADYAASGVSSDSGSVLDILRQAHMNSELDRLNIIHGGEVKAINYENRASSAREGARKTRSAEKFNAFTSLFGGAAKAGMYSDWGSRGENDYSMSTSGGGSGYGSSGGSYSDTGSVA